MALALVIGSVAEGVPATQAAEKMDVAVIADGDPVTGPAVEPEATPVVTPETETSMTLNYTTVNRMAGKTFKLTVNNIPAGSYPVVTYTSTDESVAVAEEVLIAGDHTSASATIKLLSAGNTVIFVEVNGIFLSCSVKVVPKFGKKDFSGYRPKSFISDCSHAIKKKKYTYYFDGEWGKPAKYGSTYRGAKIGMKMSEVEKLYGELNLKTCKKSKDPFLYDYQFNTSSKKLKVSKYVNFSYKTGGITHNLRIYFTSSGKVFGFILLGGKDFKKISRSMLKSGKRSDMKLV
ncbi:MAG: hypothetical protein VZQ83_09535 [Eubacterium sp.]|nr:hypothetical protein [Eubacterium sp.]